MSIVSVYTKVRTFFAGLRFRPRFYVAAGCIASLYIIAFFFLWIQVIAIVTLVVLVALALLDGLRLFLRRGIFAERKVAERLSNGDDNIIDIVLVNHYPFTVHCQVIDELPEQFQQRGEGTLVRIHAKSRKRLRSKLRPTERGEYHFGIINVLSRTTLGLVERIDRCGEALTVPVYPSFLQMRRYELLAATNRLSEVGIKKIRRRGAAREFEQIREYVAGDEYRSINWKATARRSDLMVNQYQDEKSQPVYSIIDMGRTMFMPFEQMSLLDYAINTSLVLSNIAMLKDDKAGLITFREQIASMLKAEKGRMQLQTIMEMLYNQKTTFLEANFEMLAATVRRSVHQRSLLFVYTNFETLSSLKRQLPYLTMMAKSHVVCVVLFQNTELNSVLSSSASSLEDIYVHTIAEKFAYEKKLIVAELQRQGIYAFYTAPKDLSVNTINTYLDLKARGVL